MSNDISLKANYKYMEPILSLRDTVKIGKSDKVATVKVENKGSEEMEWTTVSNTSWIKIASGSEGIDTDYITLEVEPNVSGAKRLGSITVTAPETAEYTKNVIILQSNEDVSGIGLIQSLETPKISHIPGTDSYSVLLDIAPQDISLDVYSISGQLVLRNYFYNTSTFGFDLSHCNQGVYLIKMVYDGKPYIQKITK